MSRDRDPFGVFSAAEFEQVRREMDATRAQLDREREQIDAQLRRDHERMRRDTARMIEDAQVLFGPGGNARITADDRIEVWSSADSKPVQIYSTPRRATPPRPPRTPAGITGQRRMPNARTPRPATRRPDAPPAPKASKDDLKARIAEYHKTFTPGDDPENWTQALCTHTGCTDSAPFVVRVDKLAPVCLRHAVDQVREMGDGGWLDDPKPVRFAVIAGKSSNIERTELRKREKVAALLAEKLDECGAAEIARADKALTDELAAARKAEKRARKGVVQVEEAITAWPADRRYMAIRRIVVALLAIGVGLVGTFVHPLLLLLLIAVSMGGACFRHEDADENERGTTASLTELRRLHVVATEDYGRALERMLVAQNTVPPHVAFPELHPEPPPEIPGVDTPR